MKTNVYDTDQYETSWKSKTEIHTKEIIGYRYLPLQQLSDFLYYSILIIFIASASQITLGLFSIFFLNYFSLWLAVLAMVFLIKSLLLIQTNLHSMFNYLKENEE
jgi:hypothetical protein